MKDLYFYQVTIFHKRTKPFKNFFSHSYPAIMLNLEKCNAFKRKSFFSINKFNFLSFYSKDHGARKKDASLSIWVKNTINKKFKQSENLTVYLLSIPRFLGYVFNPISIYFCIDDKKKLKFVIYEVKNTHHEQHCYVFKINKKNTKKHTANKKLYVSPFLRSDMRYDFSLNSIFPFVDLKINASNKSMQLLTGLKAKEIPFSNTELLKVIFKNFFFSQKIMLLIHFQAIKIFKKGKKFFFKTKKNKDTISFHE
jgi:DUF1365 family protein|tara:strand:+ start:310 stop:1068 length:759 start_codon:yes stop_codon:yes gene_type:complete